MRYLPRAILAGGLGAAASILVACGGGSGLLSADQASSLSSQLNQVSGAVDSGQCNAASSAASGFASTVQSLSGVNPRLADNLKQGAATLSQVASRECKTSTTTTTSSTTSTSTPTATATSTSSSAPTATSTPTTTAVSTSTATTPAPSGTSHTGGTGGGAGITGGNGGGAGGNGSGNGPSSGGGGINPSGDTNRR